MTRATRQKPVEVEASDDELPALSTLLKGSLRKNAQHADRTARLDSTTMSPQRRNSSRRQGTATANSARPGAGKQVAVINGLDLNRGISAISLSASTIDLPPPISPVKRRSPAKSSLMTRNERIDGGGHPSSLKRSSRPALDQEHESGAATSMQQRQRSLKLAHVNSLLLPLSQIALGHAGMGEDSDVEFVPSSKDDVEVRGAGIAGLMLSAIGEKELISKFDARDVKNRTERYTPRSSPTRAAKEKAKCFSRLVLKEAGCSDDLSDSSIDNDEDEEFTDLSGFIVDDNAELSFDDSDSDGNSDFDSRAREPRRKESSRKQVLRHRRNEAGAAVEDEDEHEESMAKKENIKIGDTAQDLSNLKLGGPTNKERIGNEVEIIDLTYSPPEFQQDLKAKSTTIKGKDVRLSSETNPFVSDDNDHLLKLSPPRFKHPRKEPLVSSNSNISIGNPTSKPADLKNKSKRWTTPPSTPPASPTKLKSPSRLLLLSPSKRGATIPTSPHRQSIDAFWSSDVINNWNDQYSPRKLPLTANPKKGGLDRLLDFEIWSDSDNEDTDLSRDRKNGPSSSSDPPTPTHSPSPSKTPKSPSKLSSPSKKALTEAKKLFLSTRHDTAKSLLIHLDTHITSSQLSQLCASTGGVQILWSKNLRSTAGRANWRRTVTKPSQEPQSSAKSTAAWTSLDSASVKPGLEGKPPVQHYASIELAEKVIDSDSRLVNTLAHEFCHLANFMVSGVRDQPHGPSFKTWADKVTTHLRTAPNLPSLYRAVEVTTKHSYVINHKYLWSCAGTAPLGSAQAAARAFLALEDFAGCGAEYGRHSKSIDPEKQRCGKCKGLLVQVRPKPKVKAGKAEPDGQVESPKKGRRASPTKWRIGSEGGLRENEGVVAGGHDDKSDRLEKALEDINLSG